MARLRLLSGSVLGAACCVFAGVWLVGLLLGHRTDFFNLLAVATSSTGEPLMALARQGMTRPSSIRFTFSLFMVQVALVGVLIWVGVALFRSWPSARWSCVSFVVFAIATALTDTIGRMFFLTQPGELIKVSAFILDGAVIVFALCLQGATIAAAMGPITPEQLTS